MKIKIKNILINNFKCFLNNEIHFKEQVSVIEEFNGFGKTTIVNAYLWALFGKNTKGVSDSDVIPYTQENKKEKDSPTSVRVTLDVDGKEVVFCKKLQNGVYIYEYNNITEQATRYQCFLSELSVQNADLLLYSNPVAFFSWHWKEQRDFLLTLVDKKTDKEIATNSIYSDISFLLDNDIDSVIDVTKKQIKSKEKSLEQNEILYKNISFYELKGDIELLEKEKEENKKLILSIEKICSAESLENKLEKLKIDANSLIKEEEISLIKLNDVLRKEIQELNKERSLVFEQNLYFEKDFMKLSYAIELYRSKVASLSNQDLSGSGTCNACGQELQKIEEKEILKKQEDSKNEKFILEKQIEINREAMSIASKNISENNSKIVFLEGQIKEKEKSLISFDKKSFLLNDKKYLSLKNEAIQLKKKIESGSMKKELEEAVFSLHELEKEIKDNYFQSKSNEKATDDKIIFEEKIKNLKKDILKDKFLLFKLNEFKKYSSDLLSEQINGLFEGVKFKLYSDHGNGVEKEHCEALVNGVPISSVNTAGIVNAGISIVNALSERYNYYAPVFVDNAESVTDIKESENQIIKLKVK